MARGRKTGGRDFKPGENSGIPRGPDRIPRGSVKLLYSTFLDANRQTLYDSLERAAKDPRLAMILCEQIGDRLEGKPTQKVDVTMPRKTIFSAAPPTGTGRPRFQWRNDE